MLILVGYFEHLDLNLAVVEFRLFAFLGSSSSSGFMLILPLCGLKSELHGGVGNLNLTIVRLEGVEDALPDLLRRPRREEAVPVRL